MEEKSERGLRDTGSYVLTGRKVHRGLKKRKKVVGDFTCI